MEKKRHINRLVKELRAVANALGKHFVRFPGADCEHCKSDFGTEACSQCYQLMFGAGEPDSGNDIEVSGLLKYIADMMEV